MGTAHRRSLREPVRNMKKFILLAASAALLSACDARVSAPSPEKVVKKNTPIKTPPAKEEKKVENNTTIVNPPAAPAKTEEKKTTTTTTEH